jgi:ankyrin repeat protein
MTGPDSTPDMPLRWNEPLAVEATAAVQRGQADSLRRLLAKHPGLARVWIVKDGEAAGSRTLLHLFADWPGHRRNPSGIVAVLAEAGADLDASMVGPDGPSETPLHWAASNDDVELVDALIDAGANIEAPGSIIGGLGPIADAAAFGGTLAGLRLVERGARTNIYQAAALGLADRVRAELAARPGPDPERITTAFWAACGGGHQEIAVLLRAAGADINWTGWNNQNPLDAALAADHTELASWLQANGGHPAAAEPPSTDHTP